MPNARRFMMVAVVTSLMALGCGSDAPSTQPAARDQASTAACNYYARCMEIGPGKTFVNREDCLTQVKANFQTRWPADQCTSISANGINNCITAINIAACGNLTDIANVLLNKCTQANVCVATK